jgi:hypothetical protein
MNDAKAAKYLKPLANQGHAKRQNASNLLLHRGHHVPIDDKKLLQSRRHLNDSSNYQVNSIICMGFYLSGSAASL